MNTRRLNTHAVGYTGLAVGGSAIIASVTTFFRLLTNAKYDQALGYAILHCVHHIATDADGFVIAQLVAAFMGIVGAFTIACLLCYYGMPSKVGNDPAPDGGNVVTLAPPAGDAQNKAA